jgi:hypothetical protein
MRSIGLVGATRLLIGKYLGRSTPSICLWCRDGWRQVSNIGHRSVIRVVWGLRGLGLGYVFFSFFWVFGAQLSLLLWREGGYHVFLSILEGSGRVLFWVANMTALIGCKLIVNWFVVKCEQSRVTTVERRHSPSINWIIYTLLFVSHNDTFKHRAVKTGHPIRKLLLSIMSRVLQMEFQDVADHSSISWNDQSRADTWPFAVPIQISPIVPK